MHVTGQLQEGIEPFETRVRVEFHDEADGRTRLESGSPSTWRPPARRWLEAFTKLDATLGA